MNRRGFLRSIGLGIGGIALEQAIPLGRVWSFPKKVVVPEALITQQMFFTLLATQRRFLLTNDKVRLFGGPLGEHAMGRTVGVIKSIDHARRTITLDYPA